MARVEYFFRTDKSRSKWGFYLGIGISVGIVAIALHSADNNKVAEEVGSGLLLAGSSLFSGLLIGFLFGIPKSAKLNIDKSGANSPLEKPEASYSLNTNLEDISDWLTKMLVGVGLVQLKEIPAFINKVSIYWEKSVGSSFPAAYVAALIIFFSLAGFLIGYLWTRLALIEDFIEQDPRRLVGSLGDIALSSTTPIEVREDAARRIAAVLTSPSAGVAERAAASAELLRIKNSSSPVQIRSIAKEGLELVAKWEGERLQAFPGPMGVMVIGYGHTLSEEELTSGKIVIIGEEVDYAAGLNSQQARDLLDQDLELVRKAVDSLVAVPVSNSQRDALVSFVFSVGINAFKDSTLLRVLNEGSYSMVPNELMKWCKVGSIELPGLLRRRKEEIELWNKSL